MKSIGTLSVMVVSLCMASCLQVSSWQTAKTVGHGDGEILVGLGGLGITDPFGEDVNASLAALEIMGRYGVSEKVDIGLKISSFSSYVFDAKFQLVGDQSSSFALAVGPGLGVTVFLGTDGIFQGHLPLHMSIHPSDRFALYLTPKYASQFTLSNGALHYAGGSFGLEFGNNVKFGLDISYMELLNDNNNTDVFEDFGLGVYQIGIGAKFRIRGRRNQQ